jgi:acetylornithine deacetylase/succinyl-diaminopimelate desuccinylase-like protein
MGLIGEREEVKFSVAVALVLAGTSLLAGCGKEAGTAATKATSAPAAAAETKAKPRLGIRPNGDEAVKIDMSQIHSDELKKVFQYVDDHIDDHVENLQKWIRQPSISNTGEGMQESAEMVKGFFDQLGCQESQVYDVGITAWGQQGNPVVYANCDEGAPKTVVLYWMYDTMPVTQPDLWKAPPFEGQLVEQPPYKKVLIGRGAVNSKGPQVVQLNALMSIKAVAGKLPVNIIFVAEGDEERMSMGFRKFMLDHPEKFAKADAVYRFGNQESLGGGSEGLFYIELTTSGAKWGNGPNYSDIHGINKRTVLSPAWRHMQMLATLVDPVTQKVKIPGFYDNVTPLTKAQEAKLHEMAKTVDLKQLAKNLGVERFFTDDPYEYIKQARYGTSMNLDGIWGGNMFAGGSGSILPNKVTSKHSFRYVPNVTSEEIVSKLRKYLDSEGYKDVEINIIGDQPWARAATDTEIGRAAARMYDTFGIPHKALESTPDIFGGGADLAGAWPAYLFVKKPGINDKLDIPTIGGSAGLGGNAHAANEYYVIEGQGKTYGIAGAEKSVATVLYNFAGKN